MYVGMLITWVHFNFTSSFAALQFAFRTVSQFNTDMPDGCTHMCDTRSTRKLDRSCTIDL